MKQNTKNILVLSIVLLIFIAGAVGNAVYNNDYILFIFLALAILLILLGSKPSSFTKLMNAMPGDYKFVNSGISTIDIGNIRFNYRVYVKSMVPFTKSYISMEVGIPFLPGKEEAIIEALESILQIQIEEGDLTDYNTVRINGSSSDEDAWDKAVSIGRYFRLEFLEKKITASRLISLQERIMAIVDKYKLQDFSWCIMSGRDYGTFYTYYKGNQRQSSVQVKDTFDRAHSDYKQVAQLHLNEFESLFEVDRYMELYQLSSRDLGKEELHFADVIEISKRMFKKTKTSILKITDSENSIAANITIPKLKSASTYYLIHADNRWWIYAQGRLDNISPISADDESTACDLFLRIISRLVDEG